MHTERTKFERLIPKRFITFLVPQIPNGGALDFFGYFRTPEEAQDAVSEFLPTDGPPLTFQILDSDLGELRIYDGKGKYETVSLDEV